VTRSCCNGRWNAPYQDGYSAFIKKRDSIREVLRLIKTNLPPLTGIFHSAPVLDDAPIIDATDDSLDRTMAAKAYGAWLLHEKTAQSQTVRSIRYRSNGLI